MSAGLLKNITGLKEGNVRCFEVIFNLYNGKVYNFVNSLVKDEIVAKDITQDIFVNLWTKRTNIDTNNNFEGYLFVISRNMVYHYIRRELLKREFTQQKENAPKDYIMSIESTIDREYLIKKIETLVEKLPTARRKIFNMYWKNDMKYGEIAEKLNISEKTVATQVQRSLKFIRANLA